MEVLPKVKRHLGLDAGASWIVLAKANEFVWSGVHLQPTGCNQRAATNLAGEAWRLDLQRASSRVVRCPAGAAAA
jgi:hypothetical protein